MEKQHITIGKCDGFLLVYNNYGLILNSYVTYMAP